MRIQRSSKRNKIVLIAALLLLASAGAVAAYFYYSTDGFKNSDASNVASSDRFKSDNEQSKELQDNPDNKDSAPNTDHPATPTTTTESSKKQVQMIASTDQSGNTVFIRGGVNYPVSGGSCYAQLSGPSGQSIRKDSSVLSNPASTDCKTISIPMSELASGKWKFTLHYTSNDYEGASNEISFAV